MNPIIRLVCIPVTSSIRSAVACIDRNEKGIALVLDANKRLVGTISDGDVRRAWISGQNLDQPVRVLLASKANSEFPKPVTAPVGTKPAEILKMMKKYMIRHVPLVDADGRVVALVMFEELVPDEALPVKAVVMAGGFGRRMMPLTKRTPKPMLKVGKRPMLELVVRQLRRAGIKEVSISTHYQGGKISKYFKDGRDFGIRVRYLNEAEPLGTAGAIGLMDASKKPTLVVNGDILTGVDFRAMLAFHQESKAAATVAVQKYSVDIDYGVLEAEGGVVKRIVEKPRYVHLINAGIYLLEPFVHRLIPRGRHLDMPELLQRILRQKGRVVSFPIREYWLDLGSKENYRKARADASKRMNP